MTYDITFVRRPAGMTTLQTLEWQNATTDPNAEPPRLKLTPAQGAAWQRIVQRIGHDIGHIQVELFPTHLELAHDNPRVRLDYRGDSADLSIPYWYTGHAAQDAITTAYALGRILEEETNLQGLDCQTEQGIAEANVALAVSHYAATSTLAQGLRDNL